MFDTVFLILSCVGATLIITSSSIFNWARSFIEKHSSFFGEMVRCPMCMGFWVGLFFGYFLFNYSILYSMHIGFVASLASFAFGSVIGLLNSIDYFVELHCDEGEGDE